MSELYRPVLEPPPPNPHSELKIEPIPLTIWRDGEIRRAMEVSVLLDQDDILAFSKELAQQQPVVSSDPVLLPFQRPSCSENGRDNDILKKFANQAYDALWEHFSEGEWDGWLIAPLFKQEDDTRESFQLRLFIDERFCQTVVE